MATQPELDPMFVRALRLLHSRAKDSADQLKSMLDDVIKLKSSHINVKIDLKKSIPFKGIETAVIKSSNDYKKENEKKVVTNTTIEKSRIESFEYPTEKKRMRLETTPQTSRSTSSSPIHGYSSKPVTASIPSDERSVKVEEDSEATDIEDENTDAGEFAVEMGLACVICKQIDIQSNNQLVECQECHSLYHQECHKPPVIGEDVSDPRFVWYCAKCQKTMKKIAIKPSKGTNKSPVQTPTLTSTTSQSKEFLSQSIKSPVKGETNSDPRLIPFKRVETKVSVPSSPLVSNVLSNSSTKPIGLAALASISRSTSSSNASNKAKSTSNNGNGNNSSTNVISGTSLLTNTDKRLQSVKKSKTGRK